jgi:DNA modification methylase
MNAADAEEFTQALEAVLEGNAMSLSGAWRLRGDGLKRGVPEALGMGEDEWCDRLGKRLQRFKVRDDRKKAAKELQDDGLNTRQIANALGAGVGTIHRDLNPVPNGTEDTGGTAPDNEIDADPVPNGTPDPEELAEPGAPKTDAEHAAEKDRNRHRKSDLAREEKQNADVDAEPAAVQLVHGDARDVMPTLTAASVSLVLTDPPYGISYSSGYRWASATREIVGDDNDALLLMADTFGLMMPALTDDAHVMVFCRWQEELHVRKLVAAFDLEVRSRIIWAKPEGGMGALDRTFAPAHECIVHAARPAARMRIREPDVLAYPRVAGAHPAAKPVELLERLICATTEPGALVVDPFAGEASTLVAAMKTGRRAVGVELDDTYFENGRRRVSAES